MRVLVASAFIGVLLAGCTAGPVADPQSACAARGYAMGTEEYRACMDAGGVAIATGPGSPYANVDEDEDNGT